MIRKADPDFVRRFFINEAVKMSLRRLYARAVIVNHGKENKESAREQAEARAAAFWQEYAELDSKWIGDIKDIKAQVAKESA
jgi:hypothetical protein